MRCLLCGEMVDEARVRPEASCSNQLCPAALTLTPAARARIVVEVMPGPEPGQVETRACWWQDGAIHPMRVEHVVNTMLKDAAGLLFQEIRAAAERKARSN